jgi:hypothetical protein
MVADITSLPSCQEGKPTAGREGGGRLRPTDRLGSFVSRTARQQHLVVNEPAVVDNQWNRCRLRSTSQLTPDPLEAQGGACVDHICVVIPLLPGKTEEARVSQRELDTERKAEYDRSERQIGISKEYWFIASAPSGDQRVVYMETADFTRALGMFSQSQEPFDVWFKQQLAEVSGVDLGNLPPDMQLPELVSSYEA